MVGVSARVVFFAVVIAMALLSTSSAVPLPNSIGKAMEEMQVNFVVDHVP